jgi:hypothetical protein
MLWLILGLLIGAGVVYLATRSDLKLAWFDWVIGAVGLALALLAIQNYAASMAELEPRAAGILLATFGIPALIVLGAFIARLVVTNKAPASVSADEKAKAASD